MSFLFRQRTPATESKDLADRLHDHLVAVVRRPVFYLRFGVPDTFEGRFDLLVLHVALALHRLRQLGERGDAVAQHLVDTMFARFDVALRELGVSDIGVPKRMKRLARAFNGRTTSYFAAFEAHDRQALGDTIGRNVLAGTGDGQALAAHAFRVKEVLALADLGAPSSRLPDIPDPVDAV